MEQTIMGAAFQAAGYHAPETGHEKLCRLMAAVVKAARDGAELIISTYHICTGKKLKAALKKGTIVRDDGTW